MTGGPHQVHVDAQYDSTQNITALDNVVHDRPILLLTNCKLLSNYYFPNKTINFKLLSNYYFPNKTHQLQITRKLLLASANYSSV
jgi:hypothetical protein